MTASDLPSEDSYDDDARCPSEISDEQIEEFLDQLFERVCDSSGDDVADSPRIEVTLSPIEEKADPHADCLRAISHLLNEIAQDIAGDGCNGDVVTPGAIAPDAEAVAALGQALKSDLGRLLHTQNTSLAEKFDEARRKTRESWLAWIEVRTQMLIEARSGLKGAVEEFHALTWKAYFAVCAIQTAIGDGVGKHGPSAIVSVMANAVWRVIERALSL